MAERKTKQPTASPAHTRASVKYNATHIKQISFQLNVETDADVLSWLDQITESKRGYILRLIREDMSRQQNEQ